MQGSIRCQQERGGGSGLSGFSEFSQSMKSTRFDGLSNILRFPKNRSFDRRLKYLSHPLQGAKVRAFR